MCVCVYVYVKMCVCVYVIFFSYKKITKCIVTMIVAAGDVCAVGKKKRKKQKKKSQNVLLQ